MDGNGTSTSVVAPPAVSAARGHFHYVDYTTFLVEHRQQVCPQEAPSANLARRDGASAGVLTNRLFAKLQKGRSLLHCQDFGLSAHAGTLPSWMQSRRVDALQRSRSWASAKTRISGAVAGVTREHPVDRSPASS